MNLLFAIFLMAIVTYAIRCLPLIFIKEHIDNRFIQSFLYYIPYGILTAMTVPYIFYATGNPVSALAGTLTALVLGWLKKSLITVSLIAVGVAYIIEIMIL